MLMLAVLSLGRSRIPDISFIQNSLTELPETVIDTDTLVANSCVVPNAKQKGTFILTGAGGLPERPGDSVSLYPTGTVRPVADNRRDAQANAPRLWQVGDSIVEPQGVYQLNNGKLVMSRQCSRRSFVFFE